MARYHTPEGIKAGDRYGILTVVRFAGRNKRYQAMFEARCDCGAVSVVLGTNLKRRNTTRCNAGVHRIDHGMIDAPEYQAWKAMNWRVKSQHPKIAPYYRDKGILVCEEWKQSFPNFLAHIGMMPSVGLTVDRINGNGHYEPGNVRWATRREQLLNQSRK